MNDWPAGRDEQPRYGRGSGSARPESARSLPHVRRRQAPPAPAAPPRTPVPPQPQS
ncbi:LytR family transcriptional regulator, partial [Streptomyces sp. PGLac3x]